MIDKEKLRAYKNQEELKQSLIESIAAKRVEFEEENKVLFDQLKQAGEYVESMKAILKEEGLAEFAETDNKQLTGGLGVRVSSYLEYDEKNIIPWCKINMPVAVVEKLDKKVFESFAKDNLVPGAEKKEKTSITFPKELMLDD